MRALIVRLSSIGDVVHTLPVAAVLKAQGWKTTWVVEPSSLPILASNPAVDRTALAPSARAFRLGVAAAALRELRADSCDVALDGQGLWKSAVWARLSGARRIVGYARAWRREPASAILLSETVSLPREAVHVVDKNLGLLRPLGISALGTRDFPLPPAGEAARAVERRMLAAGLEGYLVLNVGGGWTSKLWPPERFGEVALGLRRRGLKALVTWGPGEESLARRAVDASKGSAEKCFPTTLLELVEVLRRARLVVSADTGPLHLACAVGVPVVGLYGPTDPSRNGPFAPLDRVVRRTPSCAPCHRRFCPVHDGIMRTIPPEDVLAAVGARLGEEPGGQSLAL